MASTSAYSFWMNSTATTASKLQSSVRSQQTSNNTAGIFSSGNTDSSNIFQDFLKTAQQQLDGTKKPTVRRAKGKSEVTKDTQSTDNNTVSEDATSAEAQDDTQVAENTEGEDQVVTVGDKEQVDEAQDHEEKIDPSLIHVEAVGSNKTETQAVTTEDATEETDNNGQISSEKAVRYYERYHGEVTPWGQQAEKLPVENGDAKANGEKTQVVAEATSFHTTVTPEEVITQESDTSATQKVGDGEVLKVATKETTANKVMEKLGDQTKTAQEVVAKASNEEGASEEKGTGIQMADRLEAGKEAKPELAVQGKQNKMGKAHDAVGEGKAGVQDGAATGNKQSIATSTAATSVVDSLEEATTAKVASSGTKDSSNSKVTVTGDNQTGLGVLIDHVKTGVSQGAEKAQIAQDTPVVDRDQVMEQVVLGLKGKIDAKNNQAEISLNPPNLGTLKVKIEMSDGNLSAQFISSHPVVRDLLTEHMDTLRSTLESQGITVDRLAVPTQAVTPTETSGGSQTWQNAGGDGRSAGHQEYTGRQNPGGQTGSEGQSGGDKRSQGGFTPLWQPKAEAKPVDLVA